VSECFRIGPEIVHETVDSEVIAIDLDNGSYYSLAGSGPLIWALLADGASEVELRDMLEARFGDAEAIAGDVATLLEQLRESGLIVEAERAGGVATPAADAVDGETYEAPRFERYTDMKDYFLLDPIHEVDTAGWPRPAA
jgi:hypothetical protein